MVSTLAISLLSVLGLVLIGVDSQYSGYSSPYYSTNGVSDYYGYQQQSYPYYGYNNYGYGSQQQPSSSYYSGNSYYQYPQYYQQQQQSSGSSAGSSGGGDPNTLFSLGDLVSVSGLKSEWKF
jgi:hypothetical protein